jgi:hypothetical protein
MDERRGLSWHGLSPLGLQKKLLKAHGFNRGMKGGVTRCPLLRVLGATCFVSDYLIFYNKLIKWNYSYHFLFCPVIAERYGEIKWKNGSSSG